MQCTEPKTVTARKPHVCHWCAEAIERGTQYARWACFDGGPPLECKVHPECKAAWDRGLSGPDSWDYRENVMFGDYHRGCLCEHGNCECKRDDDHA